MAIQLDHVIVPSRQRLASAKLLADLLGVPWEESRGEFTPVYVNDSLTVDFADREQFQRYHLCFRVTDADFDAIFGRVQSAGLAYRSRPRGENDMLITNSSAIVAPPPGRHGIRLLMRCISVDTDCIRISISGISSVTS